MGTVAAISLAEYLRTSYDNPDREFVAGEIRERAMPDLFHSEIAHRLSVLLEAISREQFPLYVRPELRIQVDGDKVRIPDIAVFLARPQYERPVRAVPYLVVEILSEDDRFTSVQEKLREYEQFGIPHIWLIDPYSRHLSVHSLGSLRQVPSLEIPGTGRHITFADLLPED